MANPVFYVAASGSLLVGAQTYVEARAPNGAHAAFLEADRDAGYFYVGAKGGPIIGAMCVFTSKSQPIETVARRADILWSNGAEYAALLIVGVPHALFDVARREGFCRTGYPASNRGLSEADPSLIDALTQ